MYVCVYVCVCVCMYVCVYVCVCVSVHGKNSVFGATQEQTDAKKKKRTYLQ